MKLRHVIVAALLMMGCEFHSYPEPIVVQKSQPTQTVVYTEPIPSTTVVFEEVYVCEPSYEPIPLAPSYCTDYGVGVGYCCTYEYGDWDYFCAEEWCWWEDMCYWDNVDTFCSALY